MLSIIEQPRVFQNQIKRRNGALRYTCHLEAAARTRLSIPLQRALSPRKGGLSVRQSRLKSGSHSREFAPDTLSCGSGRSIRGLFGLAAPALQIKANMQKEATMACGSNAHDSISFPNSTYEAPDLVSTVLVLPLVLALGEVSVWHIRFKQRPFNQRNLQCLAHLTIRIWFYNVVCRRSFLR